MNENDSQKIAAQLLGLGFQPAATPAEADLILFNTCTVREKAHHKAFSEIGKAAELKRGRPPSQLSNGGPLIGVCGCVAQEEGARLLSRFPEIDLVFGPDQIYKLPTLIELVEKRGQPVIATELINSAEDYHFLDAVPATRLNGASAFVTIMKGCNSQCSYCIVPFVRGKEVYRPAREILREAGLLVEKGCKEVTLLGQNVNSYGTNTADGITFAKLIRLIAENSGVSRIRFTSPHPKDCKDDLIEEYASNSKLCAHIHLPLQSGSDAILRRMRRAYNTRTFREKTAKLRAARPGIAITTDIIAGFPGESDGEFQQTLDFLKEIRFDNLFGFKYSPRPDTEAFGMPDDVPQRLKESRLAAVLDLQREISLEKNRSLEGTIQEVLVEGGDKRGLGKWSGRNGGNKIVNFAGQEGLLGDIVKVKIMRGLANSLEGSVANGG